MQTGPVAGKSPQRVLVQPSRSEIIATILLLLLASDAILPLLALEGFIPYSAQQLIWAGAFAVVGIIVLLNYWKTYVVASYAVSALLFSLVGLASSLWSEYPSRSFLSGLLFVMTTLTAIVIAFRLSINSFIRCLSVTLVVLVLASLVMVAVDPGLGTHSQGYWRGVFDHKNKLGAVAALTVLVWLDRLRQRSGSPLVALGVISVSGLVVALASSQTALVLTLFGAALLIGLPLLRPLGGQVISLFLIGISALAIPAFSLMAGYWSDIVGALDRDITLTGRTDIWSEAIDLAIQRPVTGYGYDAFWLGLTSPSRPIIEALGFQPAHAHNILLDVSLELGLLGLIPFLMTVIIMAYLAFRAWWIAKNAHSLIVLIIVVFVLSNNLVSSYLMDYGSFWWLITVYLLAAMALERRHIQVPLRKPSSSAESTTFPIGKGVH